MKIEVLNKEFNLPNDYDTLADFIEKNKGLPNNQAMISLQLAGFLATSAETIGRFEAEEYNNSVNGNILKMYSAPDCNE